MNDVPDSNVTALEAENSRLKADLIRLREATRTLRERYARLKTTGPVADASPVAFDGERERLAARCEQLVARLQAKGTECVRLRQRVNELEDASSVHYETDGERERLQHEQIALLDQLKALRTEQTNLQTRYDAREKENENLQAQLAEQIDRNRQLAAQLDLLHLQLAEAEARARQVTLDDFDLEDEPPPLPDDESPEMSADDAGVDSTDDEAGPVNTGSDRNAVLDDGAARELHNDLAIAQAMLGEAVDELGELAVRMRALDARAETLSQENSQAQITTDNAEAEALAEALAQLQTERAAQSVRLEELDELLTLAETQREAAARKLDAREAEFADLRADYEALQAEAATLTNELDVLQAWRREQIDMQAEADDDDVLAALQAELDAARESERQLMATLAALQQTLVDQGAQLATAQGEAAAAVEAAYDLRDLIQERDRELIQLREILDTATRPDHA